jgi:ribosomal protein L11 methyltransferase
MTDGDAWVEMQVELAAPAAELVAAELGELLGGVELRDAETIFPTARDRAAVVALCRPTQVDEALARIEEVLATARAAGGAVDPVTIRRRPAHEDEWRDVWKQFFRTTAIGRRFVVQPSWDLAAVPQAAHVIHLDPGRAFGTGAHPSTKLVIASIERLAEERPQVASFLDLGCGSGILTIAARLLWPTARAVAADLDPEAVACTRENLARNGVEAVEVLEGSVAADGSGAMNTRAAGTEKTPATLAGPFDLILANIQRDVLEVLAPAFVPRLAPGGRLVLSGLLTSDVEPVRRRFESLGFSLRGQDADGEWASLIYELAPDSVGRSAGQPE